MTLRNRIWARRGDIAFAVLAILALAWGGPAAWQGLPRLIGAVTPAPPHAPQNGILQMALSHLAPTPPPKPAGPAIAIVIDDLGGDVAGTRLAMTLPKPVALAFLPYPSTTPYLAAEAAASGRTVLAHMPMQAQDPGRAAPMELAQGMGRDEILRRLDWAMEQVPGAVGINNHQGSRFTEDMAAMAPVMAFVKERGLFFFDSRTSPHSVGLTLARAAGIPTVGRDVFLDNDQAEDAIRAQLALLLAKARREGIAIAIGHPHRTTLKVLAEWLKQDHGVTLVTLQEAIRIRNQALLTRN